MFIFLIGAGPLSSKEFDINTYAGKITKSDNYIINWKWWENFDDPLLLDILEQSITNSFDLQVADLKIEEAENYIKSANRNFLPSTFSGMGHLSSKYSASFEIYGQTIEYDGDDILGNFVYLPLQFNYELDFWRKNRTEKNYFLENKDFYEFEKRLITLATMSEVSSLYFNILKNKELISLYQQINDLKNEKLFITLEKFKLNLITKPEVNEAEKELKKSEENLILLKALNEDLKNRLDFLVFGDKEKNDINFENIDNINLFYDSGLEISTSRIAYRPDILMAEKQIKMAKLDTDLLKKSLFPNFNIKGEILHLGQSYKDLVIKSSTFSFAPWINYKLFQRGKNRAALRAKKNVYEQMLKNYEKTIVSSINDVNNSLFYLKSSIKNYERTKEISGLDRESLDIQKQKLDMELITYSEYIETKEKFIKSRIAECESRTQCLIHTISLYKALGGNG